MAIGKEKQEDFANLLQTLKRLEASYEEQSRTRPERSGSADFAAAWGIIKSMRQLNETLLEMVKAEQRKHEKATGTRAER
jgi:hypothetical protein